MPEPTPTQSTSPGNLGLAPRIYDLSFNQDEPNSLADDTAQANALKAGSIDPDAWTVDLSRMERGQSDRAGCRAGPREETFTSSLGFGPGVRTEEGLVSLPQSLHNENYVYNWHRQPLAVLLPAASCAPKGPAPSLDYFFHPANVGQNAFMVGVEGDHVRRNYVFDPPNLGFDYVTALANSHRRIIVSGLAKTEGWNYGDARGEEVADWDAFRAVTSRYRHDRDHVRVLGMSGRLGAPFFAEMWPDRVASMATVSNHDADSPRVANLRNTPWVFTNGTSFLDTTDVPSYTTLDDHLNALAYQYVHMTWNGRGHDFNLVNQAYPLFEPWTLPPRIHPARITYYVDPKARRPDLPLFPGVDWVRAITLADGKTPARIDLTNLAKANLLPVRDTRFDCTFTNLGTTDDLELHGLSYETPAVVRSRMPDRVADGWSESSCTIESKPRFRPAKAKALSGSLENVAEITLDLDRMGIDPSEPLDLSQVQTPRPVTWQLHSVHGNRTVFPDGRSCLDTRKFRFRLHHRRGARIVRAKAFVNGRLVRSRRGRHIRTITLKRLARGRFRVRIVTISSTGRRSVSVRTYRGCKKSAPRTRGR
jgi:hypothetical protein